MRRRFTILGASLALAMSAVGPGALASDISAAHPAHIHAGVCPTPGDVVAPLTDVIAPGGDATGVASAIGVGSSVSSVPLPLADILAAEHSINVHESAENMGLYIACGDIGGTMVGASDLAIGLAEQNGSGLSGVAWLHDNGDSTTAVYVFLTARGTSTIPSESMAPASSVAPASSMAPAPSAVASAAP